MSVTRPLGICLLIWLAGCASNAPAPNRYTLPTGVPTTQVDTVIAGADAKHQLRIAPPRLARFLDSDGIVLQLDDITLNEANHHLWAEPLGAQLARGLQARLAARLPNTRVVDERTPTDGQSMTLQIDVDRFNGRYDGRAIASGQWQLRSTQGDLLAMSSFTVEQTLESDGYAPLVRALGRSWDEVADRIAAAVQQRQ
ncbi:membrane integrity-associated transporter subunit PqiC [Halomonas sp. TRM85114]|uniref:PqiC family protein n=1 Tax=Halomonas jincaotanensis TaxID=2810616 RepID=UPI001BD3C888|nr:ABC-type transport auxiliary lipoprotein family protein [Halomonas jincaotanensis]MBS9404113.1 membrane integrity-associated transporter subunit PqiC [Halomonas jincaotanensis]